MKYVKSKIFAIQTDQSSHLYSIRKTRSQFEKCFSDIPYPRDNSPARNFNLYFTIDEAPEVGDYYIYQGQVFRCIEVKNEGVMPHDMHAWQSKNGCKKVVATTCLHLQGYLETIIEKPFPRPSDDFLKKYCMLGGIEEVMIAYDAVDFDKKTGKEITYWGYETDMLIEDGTIEVESRLILKVAPDNTITIRGVKNLWNRSEVAGLFNSAFDYAKAHGMLLSREQWETFRDSLL